MRSRPRAAAGALLLGVVVGAGVLVSGCAEPADDPRTGASGASGAPRTGMRNCPAPPEPPQVTPSPCISQDQAGKYAENHGYRREQEITAQQRAGAQGTADALAAELTRLAGKPLGPDEVRAAVAPVLGLKPNEVEIQVGARGKGLEHVAVGGGQGKVCVNGRVDSFGTATAEVAGRTMDGTCLPGLGGH